MKNEDKEDEQSEVFNLILKLQQEKVYVTNERDKIQQLNVSVRTSSTIS